MAYINQDDFVGRTFLLDEQEDGSRKRAKIVECINDYESDLKNDPDFIKFRCAVDEDTYGEIITYNELMDFLQKNEEQDAILWKFKRIIGHKNVKSSNPEHMGSKINLQIEWENAEITWEPLKTIATDDPVTCATKVILPNYSRKTSDPSTYLIIIRCLFVTYFTTCSIRLKLLN